VVAVGLVGIGVAVVVAASVSMVAPSLKPTALPSSERPVTPTTRASTGGSSASGTTPVGQTPLDVGTLSFTVTEPAGAGSVSRSITTVVRYPAVAGTGASGTPATPDRATGPYPLVVFSGGYAVSPEEYSSLLDAWAAAGYVVADPFYPFTTPTSAQGLDEGDIIHHPTDLSAVITALVDADRRTPTATGAGAVAVAGPVDTLAGAIEPGAIAAIGHSDGGDVTLAATSNPCCRDARIRAAVVLSGAEDGTFGGTYFATPTHVPLLVVQGTDDTINPAGCSVQAYDQSPQPKFYLSMLGQSHQGPYLQSGTPLAAIERVTIDFLDGELKGSTSMLAGLAADGNVPGTSSLTGADSVTTDSVGAPSQGGSTGSCPGAPGS
jgi:fermentation-respiration switch protein FrsA (DUF1100 family)